MQLELELKNQQKGPGHAINEGYPYRCVETESLFPNRPEVTMGEDGIVHVAFSEEHFGKMETELQMNDFILFRLFDYSEALKIAEAQIKTLLEEEPFIPEEFGFECVHQPDSIHDSPVRVYSSKYDERFSLFREVGDVSDRTWDPQKWVLMKKNDNNTFDNIPVKLPCHRIAYAVFYSLGVDVRGEQKEAAVSPVIELPPVKTMNVYDVTFERDGSQAIIPSISAESEEDAKTKALLIFATDDFYAGVPKDADFVDLTVTEHEKG